MSVTIAVIDSLPDSTQAIYVKWFLSKGEASNALEPQRAQIIEVSVSNVFVRFILLSSIYLGVLSLFSSSP